jgi:brefeldin A-inhibited guanine nucleotide-exchange protein
MKEGARLAKLGSEAMKNSVNNDFVLVNETEPIGPLFNAVWGAMFAVFSYLLEINTDPEIVELCIDGFTHSIKICGFYNMVTERDAFVGCLAKFTGLSTRKEMKDKNILCTKALL